MSFSRNFYVDESQVCLLKTATPTGTLNVPDLINGSTRHWITVNTASVSETAQKKALIFADHLYRERDEKEKNEIMARLQEARQEGFTIYVLSDKGELQAWDGKPIPATYSLDLNQCTKEYINGQAWSQHALGASKLYVLDYFGINDLLQKPHGHINWQTFKNNTENLHNLISTTPLNSLELSLQESVEIKPFLDFTKQIPLYLNNFKKINLDDELKRTSISTLGELLMAVPQIEEMKIIDCASSLTSLKQDQLKKLKVINLHHCLFAAADLEALLSAAPQVEKIKYFGSKGASFINSTERLASFQFQHLKILDFHNILVPAEPIKTLLNAAIHIEDISLLNCKNITGCFSDLKPQQLNKLKSFRLTNLITSAKDINALLHASPQLEVLTLTACQGDFSNAFSNLMPKQLNKLKNIHFYNPAITAKDISALLQAAANIEYLCIYDCTTIASGFSSLKTEELKKLKIIDLSKLTVTATDIANLINAAPLIENIIFSMVRGDIAGAFTKLKSKRLKNLTKLSFTDVSLTAADMGALFHVAPLARIEEITFQMCPHIKNIRGAFFDPNHPIKLETLKKIILHNSPLDVADVVALLRTAHELEHIEIVHCGDLAGLFQKISPLKLSKLKRITLTDCNLAAEDISKLLQAAPQLKVLTIENNQNDISGAFTELNLPNLSTINLNHSNIDNDGATYLLAACPNVNTIDFSHCANISNIFLSSTQLKNIKSIDFNYTFISRERVNEIKKSAPQARIKADIIKRQSSNTPLSSQAKIRNQSFNFSLPEIKRGQGQSLGKKPLRKPPIMQRTKITDSYFDTRETKSKLLYTRYFPGIEPGAYRLFQWQPDLNSENLETIPLIAKDFVDIELGDEEKFSSNDYQLRPGIRPVMPLEEGREIILPSLDAHEKLVSLQVVTMNGERIDPSNLKIQHSASTGFYKVILPEEGIFTISFTVAVPKNNPELPENIALIVKPIINKYLNPAPVEKAPSPGSFKTLGDFAKFLIKTPQGACRHRALAAYAELEPIYHENVSILSNDVHELLELRVEDTVYQIDLGGHEIKLQEIPLPVTSTRPEIKIQQKEKLSPIKEELHPVAKEIKAIEQKNITALEKKEEKAPPESKQLIIAETPLLRILEQNNSRNLKFFKEVKANDPAELKDELKSIKPLDAPPTSALILADTAVACQDFYAQLGQRHPSTDIFIAHCPEDLSLKGSSMTASGEIKSSYTAFSRWFEGRKKGVIVIDASDFKNNEIAQLNDLLDRRIEGQQLPLDIQIIIVDHPDRGYYGPDFRRRVPIKATLTAHAENLLKDAQLAVADEQIDTIEIDLFNSAYWQRILIGSWQLEKQSDQPAFSFKWNSGSLLKALPAQSQSTNSAKPMQIIFKNPPLHDPSFTAFMAELQSLRCIDWADQTTQIPTNISFYQSSGYDWPALASQASLASLTYEAKPYVLSDANILSFIKDPSYAFTKDNGQLQPQNSYLRQCKEDKEAKGTIDIVCAPGLSESTLAQLLTEAQKQAVKVRFLTPNTQAIPDKSPLHRLTFAPVQEIPSWRFNNWQLHDDLYFATRYLQQRYPKATCIDLSSLEAAELGRYPILPKELRENFLKKGQLSMTAPLSAIIKKLQAGETVILSGKVPPALYETLTSLVLKKIEGERFNGELIIVTPPQDAPLAEAITGKRLELTPVKPENKVWLLNQIYPEIKMEVPEGYVDYARLQRQALQNQLNKTHQPLPEQLLPLQPNMSTEEKAINDEKNAKIVDRNRLHDVEQGLKISPWVMLEGATGIGKTYFLQQVLPKKQTVFTIKEWLERKPTSDEPIILVVDEASFRSELGDEGENFLERFKGLQGKPPGMLWKGTYYPLTEQHKVIFAFNPASYGAGRSTAGLLSEQALKVSFEALPDFYVRARVITPLLQQTIADKKPDAEPIDVDPIAESLSEVYRWIINNSKDRVQITPREIKLMVNLIASWVNQYKITDSRTLSNLALEVAYDIGRQTLADYPAQVALFEANFKESLVRVRDRIIMPKTYRDCQHEAYCQIQALLAARALLSSPNNTDLGLGGLILEGGSGIGKSHFLTQIANDYKIATGQPVYFISPNTSYREKEAILRQAFDEGALVIAEEFNTSLWPNKLLNNYLMGLDEFGKPATKPGFMLLATQNPPSFGGRSEEDPALRQRCIKMKLDWLPVDPASFPVSIQIKLQS